MSPTTEDQLRTDRVRFKSGALSSVGCEDTQWFGASTPGVFLDLTRWLPPCAASKKLSFRWCFLSPKCALIA